MCLLSKPIRRQDLEAGKLELFLVSRCSGNPASAECGRASTSLVNMLDTSLAAGRTWNLELKTKPN